MDYNEALKIVSSSDTAEKEEKLKEYETKISKTKKMWNTLVIIAFVLAAIALCAFGYYRMLIGSPLKKHEYLINDSLLTAFLALAGIGIVLLIVRQCSVGALKKKMKSAEAYIKANNKTYDTLNNECSKLYEMCASNGITELNENNEGDLMLVAKQFGLTKPEDARYRFKRGKALSIINDVNKANQSNNEIIAQADEYLKQAQEQSALVGKAKYKEYAKKQAIYFERKVAMQKMIETSSEALADVARNNKPRDWGTAGGLASAALGPAAGVTVAASIQQQNQRDAEHAANVLERSGSTIKSAHEKGAEYMKFYEAWKRQITKFDDLIADEDEKYFSGVQITAQVIKITPAGTMEIRAKSQIEGDSPALLGKPALIDGSFTLYVCENGRRIGSTIVCAPDFDSIECKKNGLQRGCNDRPVPPVRGREILGGSRV